MAAGQKSPARGALVRWCWRLFRREWHKQALLLSLVTVAVAAAVGGTAAVTNIVAAHDLEFGDAQAMVRLDGTVTSRAAAGIAAARRRFGTVEVIGHSAVSVPGSAPPLDLRSEDPHGTFGHVLLARRQGRLPSTRSEVALTSGASELLSVQIGDRVRLGGIERTVVGLVENPRDLGDQFALIAPEPNAKADSLTLLFDESRRGGLVGGDATGNASIDFPIMGRGDAGPVAVLLLVAVTLALSLVGLIVAAGFVVVAQRRQRQLGLLAAIGATQRQLRLVMLANGAIVGTAGALLGGALGVLGWIVASPSLETAAGHRIDRLDLPWFLVAGCVVLAVAMAMAAAWWPARNLSRLPVMAALSGRPPRPLPIHRSVAVALILLVAGIACIALARPTGDHVRPPLLIAGMAAVIVGVVLAAPAALRIAAAPAARLPFAVRLALRDLVRHQARAAAALAAMTLGVGIAAAAIGIASASEYRAHEGNLSARQLLVRAGDAQTFPNPAMTRAERARLDAKAARIAATISHATLFKLDVAMNPATARDPSVREPIALSRPLDSNSSRLLAYPYVATPDLLRHYGIDPSAIRTGTDLLTARSGDVELQDFTARPDGTSAATRVQRVDLPLYTSSANSLVTNSAVRRHGWVRVRTGWLVESPRTLTAAEIAAARSAAAELGLTIETRSTQDALATLRSTATAVGILLALAIVGMAVSLIRGESANDVRTLTATGAAGRTRRALSATTAGSLGLLAAALGTGGAYLALIAGYHAELGRLAPLPARQLLLLGIGLPLAAVAGGWLLGGREPAAVTRQGLD